MSAKQITYKRGGNRTQIDCRIRFEYSKHVEGIHTCGVTQLSTVLSIRSVQNEQLNPKCEVERNSVVDSALEGVFNDELHNIFLLEVIPRESQVQCEKHEKSWGCVVTSCCHFKVWKLLQNILAEWQTSRFLTQNYCWAYGMGSDQ